VAGKATSRPFQVHEQHGDVYPVGTVRGLFSTNKEIVAGAKVAVQKVLMTNDLDRSIEDVVEIYDLRWQMELFFKERKSIIGLADYRFKGFREVQGWVNGCVLAFLYLEWYRVQRVEQAKDKAKERQRWQRHRRHGLALAVQQDVEAEHLRAMLPMSQTPQGRAQREQLLRQTLPKEYRKDA
jgi:hypothetical protein